MKKLSRIFIVFLLTISLDIFSNCYSNPGNLGGSDICEVGDCNSAFDPDECYAVVTGIPINDYSYLLVIIGGASALFMVYYKNKRNIGA